MRMLFVPYLFIDTSVFSYNEVMTEDSLQQSTYRLLKLKHMSCPADCQRIICCACQTCLIGKKRGYDVGWEVSSYSYRVSRITPDAYGMTVPPWVGTAWRRVLMAECRGAVAAGRQRGELGHPWEMMILLQGTKWHIFQLAEHSLAQCHSHKSYNEKKNMLSEVCKVSSSDYWLSQFSGWWYLALQNRVFDQ